MGKHASKSRKKRRLLWPAAAGALLLLSASCFAAFSVLGGLLLSQRAAERFRGENKERFEQVSVFFPVGKGTDEPGIRAFREKLEDKLREASLKAPENGSLWADAYSAQGEVSAEGPRGRAAAFALGVGGDYFLFHPLRLRAGGYISGDDLMHDRVVLDVELAWKLFGSPDVAGLEIKISGEPYLVAGVVERETDFANQRAYTAGAGLYMAYDALLSLSEGQQIGCYELVCISPVSGFARGIAAEGFPEAETVENSRRFTAGRIFKIMGDYGERSMNTSGVIFPYWENAARLLEDYLALLLALAVLFGLFPAFCLAVLLVILLRRGRRRIKAALPGLRDRWEERAWEWRAKRREKKHERKGLSDGRGEPSRHKENL
jgi:hypothetical protein